MLHVDFPPRPILAPPGPLQLRLPFFSLPEHPPAAFSRQWCHELLLGYEGDDPLAEDEYGAFERYDAVKASLGLCGDRPTAYWRRAAARFLGGIGLHALELKPIFSGTPEQLAEAVRLVRADTGGAIGTFAGPGRDGDGDVGAVDLAPCLPAGLRAMPRTPFDPDGDADDDAPGMYGWIDGSLRVRLSAIQPEAVRIAAIVETAIFAGEKPGVSLWRFVAEWERIGQFVARAGIDPMDPAALKGAALDYLSGRDGLCHSPGMRLAAWDRLRASHGRVGTWADDKPRCGDDALAARLARFEVNRAERGAIGSMRQRWARRGRRNRARGANEMKRKFDLILAAGTVRHAQAAHLADAVGFLEEDMRADGGRGAYDCAYVERPVDANGRPLDGVHRVYLRGHWERDLVGRVGLEPPGPEEPELDGLPAADGAFDPAAEGILVEFLRVERDDGEVVEPWFIELFRTGALLSPARLTTELRDVRRETRMRLDLPCLVNRPAGLLGPDGARETRLHEAALRAGVVLLPAKALVLGLEYANAGSRAMAMSFARFGEVQQIAQREDRWTEVGEPPFLTDAFLSIPKAQTRPCPFPVDPGTLGVLGALLVRRLAHEGLDEVPVVEPAPGLAHKCKAAPYVLAFRGAMLGVGDMNFLYAHLTAGLAVEGGVGGARHVRLRSHDIRHGAAYRGYKECGSLEVIRRRFHYLSRNDHCVANYCSEPGDPAAADPDDFGEWHIGRADFLALTGAGDAELGL